MTGPESPSRRSLLQAVRARVPQLAHVAMGSRRMPDWKSISSRTPEVIRRVLRLEPKRRMSDSGAADNRRQSVALSALDKDKTDMIDHWQPNHRQRELIKLTWSDDFEYLYNLGSNIYVYIFNHEPNAKKLFPALAPYGDAWLDSKEFRGQALKFVQTLSQTVKNVHHMDRLQPLLYNVGRAHIRFADRGFRPEYWDVFHSAIKSAMAGHIASLTTLTDEDRAEAVKVWRMLTDYVVYQMRKGYMDGLEAKGGAIGSSSSS
uniref:Globin family profile domain-containing protein n=1 Tax=Plectus sambesii TaxID=2011161 RepID=A0A914WTZ6_9BILA